MIEHRKIGFIYTVEHVGVDGKIKSVETIENIIPLVGINYTLAAAMTGASQFSTWYIGLYKADRTPLTSDTMTTLLADADESNEYGSASRLEAVFPAVDAGAITTEADPTVFTFASGATITGGFLTTGLTINNTSGLLMSAVKFTSPKVIATGELLRVPVGIALASV